MIDGEKEGGCCFFIEGRIDEGIDGGKAGLSRFGGHVFFPDEVQTWDYGWKSLV